MKIPGKLATAVAGVAVAGLLAACGSAPSQAPGGAAPAADVAGKIDETAVVDQGPVGQNLPSTPTLDRVRQSGQLLFAGSRNTLGFSQLDPASGKLNGFDAGIAQLLAKYLLGKPNAVLKSGGSDTREALLGNHSIDVAIQTYTITPDRAKLVDFAGPYYMAAEGILVKTGDTSIKQASDLAGKKVATESGAAKEALVAAIPTAQPVLFDSSHQAATALLQGRVSAVALNNASLLGVEATTPGTTLLDATFGSNPFGVGIAKDDPQFKDVVNGFLKEIESDGTWTKLWQATVGQLVKTPPPTPPAVGSVPGS